MEQGEVSLVRNFREAVSHPSLVEEYYKADSHPSLAFQLSTGLSNSLHPLEYSFRLLCKFIKLFSCGLEADPQ